MTYRLLSPAHSDLAEAMEYYDRASPGLGLESLTEVERTVQRILPNPEAWTKVSAHCRRCPCILHFSTGAPPTLVCAETTRSLGATILRVIHIGRTTTITCRVGNTR